MRRQRPVTDENIAPGQRVDGRYELVEFCAEGSFGSVWRAKDTRFRDRSVAVKFLKAELMGQSEVVERFENEAEALSQVEHPNVVAVLDRGRWAGTRYLVMEWVDGTTLARWIDSFRSNGQRPPEAAALAIFEEVCLALAAAHTLSEVGPVVHRDLKPENVMLRTRGTMPAPSVKVLDFGIARLRGGGSRTRTGVQMGTFIYMAPEQATGASRSVGPWTDVFALGVLLVEMLTGVSEPLEETAWWTVSIRGESEVNPLLDALLPSSSPALLALLRRCLRRDGPDRFPDAAALLAAFRETCAPAAASTPPPPIAAPTVPMAVVPPPAPALAAPIARPPRRVLVGLVGLVGAVAVVALVVALRPSPGVHHAPPAVTLVRPPSHAARCPDGMVFIAGATLTTGLPAALRTPADPPPASVAVAAFCIDRTEVTVAAWSRCVAGRQCPPLPTEATEDVADTPARRQLFSSLCVARTARAEALPVNCVDALLAESFCRSRGARLPSEAQWELAARGPEGRAFPWGAAEPDVTRLNACGPECVAALASQGDTAALHAMGDASDAAPTLAPVGSFPGGSTADGVADLAGNVAEWVSFAGMGDQRGVRGGSWFSARAVSVMPALQIRVSASHRNPQTGFRCAADGVTAP